MLRSERYVTKGLHGSRGGSNGNAQENTRSPRTRTHSVHRAQTAIHDLIAGPVFRTINFQALQRNASWPVRMNQRKTSGTVPALS